LKIFALVFQGLAHY